ncbi:GDSL esterase/lipase [Dichanthelium oligosanthes]|uniref:GDSL esterase/lipase n=1 Tax=Dichanthelium oligosanthes TaxID=888268 RepID=A0A1E5WBS6_9POAL|nr:GDSL esterase/lipase [Dichanthelium oligosanthes]
MSNSKCENHSFSAAVVHVLLLLNPHVGLCNCYKSIFSFGDSTVDTGNFVHLAGKTASKYNEPPYGMRFFKHATVRISNGRVLIDFYGAKQKHFLGESLVVMGMTDGKDYDNSWFSKIIGPRRNIEDIIMDVILYISHLIEELILDHGAKAFLIPNSFPIGCWASYLRRFHSDKAQDYDEHGCLTWLNEIAQKHNVVLHGDITRLKIFYPTVKLIYADYYDTAMEFMKNPATFGIGNQSSCHMLRRRRPVQHRHEVQQHGKGIGNPLVATARTTPAWSATARQRFGVTREVSPLGTACA